MSTRLKKSASDRVIDGICGGIAEYLNIDPTVVRVGWVLLALAGGVGVLLYLLAMIIMPAGEPSVTAPRRSGFVLAAGILLSAVGLVWFLVLTGFLALHSLSWAAWKLVLPGVLIVLGVFLILRRSSRGDSENAAVSGSAELGGERRLYRSRREKKFTGVCGGLGQYFSLDPVLVRILFVAFAFISVGFALVAYLLLALLTPEEPIALTAQPA